MEVALFNWGTQSTSLTSEALKVIVTWEEKEKLQKKRKSGKKEPLSITAHGVFWYHFCWNFSFESVTMETCLSISKLYFSCFTYSLIDEVMELSQVVSDVFVRIAKCDCVDAIFTEQRCKLFKSKISIRYFILLLDCLGDGKVSLKKYDFGCNKLSGLFVQNITEQPLEMNVK